MFSIVVFVIVTVSFSIAAMLMVIAVLYNQEEVPLGDEVVLGEGLQLVPIAILL